MGQFGARDGHVLFFGQVTRKRAGWPRGYAMAIRHGLFAGCLALTLAGCIIPIDRAISPGVETRLIDATTGAAVAGATVTLTPPDWAKLEPLSTVSGADGRVRFEAIKRRIWVMPLPLDLFPPTAKLLVEASGYEAYEGQAFERIGNQEPQPEPTITMKPSR
jgi:hypothetical protein